MLVGVVAAEPREVALVAPGRRAVEPLPHVPERVEPAGVRGVGVVHDPVLDRERTHSRTLVGQVLGLGLPVGQRAEVVRLRALCHRLLRERHVEVEVEVAAGGRRPREAPPHAVAVGEQLRQRGA